MQDLSKLILILSSGIDEPEGVVGIVLEADASCGIPLGVLLGKSLLGIGPYFQLLPLPATSKDCSF